MVKTVIHFFFHVVHPNLKKARRFVDESISLYGLQSQIHRRLFVISELCTVLFCFVLSSFSFFGLDTYAYLPSRGLH